ncbi:MAG: phage gp6-like head-tail connector protein [Elusimicrobia bacterium]|nr:phage gp6-like head-tail connector protein [Elusimicrobiota bacterium]
MAVSQYSLTTLEEAKTYLGIAASDTGRDALLESLIDAVSEAAQALTGRIFIARPVSGEPHQGGGNCLQLDHYPVLSVQSVSENGAELAASGYQAELRGGILTKNGRWGETVLASYTPGYGQTHADVPRPVKLACWLWLAALLDQANPDVSQERMGEYSVSYLEPESALPKKAALLLEPFRKRTV